METGKKIALINAVSQWGAGRPARGEQWLTRIQNIRSHLSVSGLEVAEVYHIHADQEADSGESSCRYFRAVKHAVDAVHEKVLHCLRNGLLPVTVGGDHSLAIGSVTATSQFLREKNLSPPGLLWMDAHIDMNTPATTPSGNIHGMALATLLGLQHPLMEGIAPHDPAVRAEHAAVIGFRFADPSEVPNVAAAGNPEIFSMRDIDQWSVAGVMEEVLPRVTINTGGIHLSLDLDCLDPSVAPGVNTPFPGGMTFREVRSICETVASTGQLVSMDLVEHNPEKGHDEMMLPVMSELVAGALGKTAMPDFTT